MKWIGRAFAAVVLIAWAVAVVWAITETSTETITHSIGPGDSPSTSVSTTVTHTVSLATSYTDTLGGASGWRTLDTNMTDVAMWYLEVDADSTSNVFKIRLIDASSDSVEFYANQVIRIYQPPDSTAVITTIRIDNPHADGQMTYHVVATGQ